MYTHSQLTLVLAPTYTNAQSQTQAHTGINYTCPYTPTHVHTHIGITIFTNPYEDMEKAEAAAEETERKVKAAEAAGKAAAGTQDQDYKVSDGRGLGLFYPWQGAGRSSLLSKHTRRAHARTHKRAHTHKRTHAPQPLRRAAS